MQNQYNLTDRSAEDVLDYCEGAGIGFIPWSPIASGSLAAVGARFTRWPPTWAPARPGGPGLAPLP